MTSTILDDIKDVFRKGNMLTKIILVNIIVFVFLVIAKILFRDFFNTLLSYLTVSSDLGFLIMHPWTILSYMFVHLDLFHLLFNMIVYYWIGNIVGDLIGDKKILPLYLLGGIGGFIAFSIFNLFTGHHGFLMGASAGVMATVSAAAFLSPNYNISLVLIGKTPLKYIAIAYVIIDLAMIANQSNAGGHISHFGGFLVGGLFIYFLRRGLDISIYFYNFITLITGSKRNKKSKLKVSYKNKPYSKKNNTSKQLSQKEIDKILEKVKEKGYESLTKVEKEFLFLASKSPDK